MNEFIVWDEEDGKFVTLEDYEENIGFDNADTHNEKVSEFLNNYFGCETFPYIGKTDDTPEQNKIYADCSVVELKDKQTRDILTGSFFYNPEKTRYEVKIYNHPILEDMYTDNLDGFFKLKVIGTLQEDRHLLGEDNENTNRSK